MQKTYQDSIKSGAQDQSTYRALAHPIARPELSRRNILADSGTNQTVQRSMSLSDSLYWDFAGL
jgi:hypothetical protein